MPEANRVLEQTMQAHMDTWGTDDRRTQQHVLNVVELLNTWNRTEDALGLLSRSKELLQGSPRLARRKRNRRKNKGKATAQSVNLHFAEDMDVDSVSDSVPPDSTPSHIASRIREAGPHVAAKDPAIESVSREVTCASLRARGELINLYEKLGIAEERSDVFGEMPATINAIRDSYAWSRERCQSLDVVEAYLQVVANMFKSGHSTRSKPLFEKVANEAEALYGFDDERAVWVHTTIGLVYQTHATWSQAKRWFESALAGALAAGWGNKDGITRSLENALEKKHFSYLSDEGRPFSSIFGVTGITIRPGRLRLE